MTKIVVVVGATGMLGEPVARRLRQDGYRVRVLARRPQAARERLGDDFEVVRGDVDDGSSLAAALDGAHGVHLSLAGDPTIELRGAQAVAGAARDSGIVRVTYLSGSSVCEDNCWFEGTRIKYRAEEVLRSSGVKHTIFRATWFMEALPKFVRGGRAMVFGRQPHPFHWLAADDYAAMVARAYGDDAAADKTLWIHGPEAMTTEEALTVYCRHLCPEVPVKHMPFLVLHMVALFGRRPELRRVIPFMRYAEKVSEGGDPTEANDLLGAPTTTLEQWCAARAGHATP